MSSSALCHEVLAGTSVASLISPGAARISAGAAAIDARIRNRFRADMVVSSPLTRTQVSGPRLFREHSVDVIEQRTRAALLDERNETDGRILVGIDCERGL